jgi:hypothetical protein
MDTRIETYASMQRFVLFDLLFELLSKNIVLIGNEVRHFIAAAAVLLLFAVLFDALQFLLKHFQTGFQLCIEKGQRFDFLRIAP